MALAQQLELCGLHTITATEASNTFIVLPYGASLPSVFARVQFQSVLLTSGSGTLTFTGQLSYDRGATWTTLATGAAITLSTTAQAGEQTLQIVPRISPPPDTGVVWIQVLGTIGGSPTGATATYRADLM